MQGIDAYDMSDPVDILKDLGKFDEDVAKTEKWALRKAVLTRLKTLSKVRHVVVTLSRHCRRQHSAANNGVLDLSIAQGQPTSCGQSPGDLIILWHERDRLRTP